MVDLLLEQTVTFTFTVDSSGGVISNTVNNTDITFKVNDAGVNTTVMTIDGSESRVGIGTYHPQQN